MTDIHRQLTAGELREVLSVAPARAVVVLRVTGDDLHGILEGREIFGAGGSIYMSLEVDRTKVTQRVVELRLSAATDGSASDR
jgi:hypothetical protein